MRRQRNYDVFCSSGKTFYDTLERVSGNDCPPPDSGVGQEAWLAISVLYFLKGEFDGFKGGQGSVQASQILPHQTHPAKPLWTSLHTEWISRARDFCAIWASAPSGFFTWSATFGWVASILQQYHLQLMVEYYWGGKSFTKWHVAIVASYCSTKLEFGELFITIHSFTHHCKG